jgi:aminoglycoside 3-N-acetyltransferase
MTAFGKRAEEYIKGEEHSDTPGSPDGCWGRLYQENAKILLVGVGQERNTFLHAVEEINHIPQRLSEEKKQLLIRNEDGTITKRFSHVHYNPYCSHISENYVKFEPYFHYGKALSYGTLGNAKVQVCDAKGCADIMMAISNHCDFDLCIDETPIPFQLEELDNLMKR